eukprot:570133-Pleurochrysis_carterae.AAC.1
MAMGAALRLSPSNRALPDPSPPAFTCQVKLIICGFPATNMQRPNAALFRGELQKTTFALGIMGNTICGYGCINACATKCIAYLLPRAGVSRQAAVSRLVSMAHALKARSCHIHRADSYWKLKSLTLTHHSALRSNSISKRAHTHVLCPTLPSFAVGSGAVAKCQNAEVRTALGLA